MTFPVGGNINASINLTPASSTTIYNTNTWALNLTQPLFRWQNWATYKQAELAVAQAEAQYAMAKQDLILRVTQAYFDVLLAQEDVSRLRRRRPPSPNNWQPPSAISKSALPLSPTLMKHRRVST